MDLQARFRGCLLGLACGDAVGTSVEFMKRGSFPPVTDMTGGGPFELPAGAWTDDTSMALCLATSLVETGQFDATDQMERYCRWFQEGYLSSTGRCFDIGITIRAAIQRFKKDNNPFAGLTDPGTAGNGCIMRLAPVPIFYFPDESKVIRWSGESSSTTHATLECIESCQLLASMLYVAFSGRSKVDVLFSHDPDRFQAPKVQAIARGEYQHKTADQISSSGYVIHCLEAAAWSFWTTDTLREAILQAVNLGDDADTTGAVCGQIAGAFYGEQSIPEEWLAKLVMCESIRQLADQLGKNSSQFV